MIEQTSLQRDVQSSRSGTAPRVLLARSPAMVRVLELTRRLALVDSTVLIAGESGVGKERIARLLHDESARSRKPFVAVNCGALSEALFESELFGYARGAFTGAVRDHAGLFEAADHGTLLLDEVGDIAPNLQVKLLRALQEREVRRIGETTSRRVNVRVIASTNRDLTADVEAGRFRLDLFHRLNVVSLRIPPLRDRREDIRELADSLLTEFASRLSRPIRGFTDDAVMRLLAHDWPGNVRELENAVEGACVLAEGSLIEIQDLPETVQRSAPTLHLLAGPIRPLCEVEQECIMAALAQNAGNRSRTAEQLRISQATLYRKLRRFSPLPIASNP